MWNYDEVDKYISIKHFQLLAKWFETQPRLHDSDRMIQAIKRETPGGSVYFVHITSASVGYTLRVTITGTEVVASQPENFWMS